MLYYQPPHGGYSLTVWDDKTSNCQRIYSILLQAAYYLSSTAAWSSNKTNFQSKYCLVFLIEEYNMSFYTTVMKNKQSEVHFLFLILK